MSEFTDKQSCEDALRIEELTTEIEKIVHELTTYHMHSNQTLAAKPSVDAICAGLKAVRGRATMIKERSRAKQGA